MALAANSTNVVTLVGVEDAVTGQFTQGATVTATVRQQNGAPLAHGASIPMPYVNGTSGPGVTYRGTIPDTVPIKRGAVYAIQVVAVTSSGRREYPPMIETAI